MLKVNKGSTSRPFKYLKEVNMLTDITQYKIPEDIVRRENEQSMFRKGYLDHNEELQKSLKAYKDKVEDLLNTSNYDNINNKLIASFDKFCRDYTEAMTKYLRHKADNPSWAVTGRSGRNARRDAKMNDRQTNLLLNMNAIVDYMNKAIDKARSQIKVANKKDEAEEVANFISSNILPKFATKDIKVGNSIKRAPTLNGYAVLKDWGSYSVYAPSGKEIKSFDTRATQKDAKEWLFWYLNKKGIYKPEEVSATVTKLNKATIDVVSEDGEYRLINKGSQGYAIQTNKTGKWLIYKELGDNLSRLNKTMARDYYARLLLYGRCFTSQYYNDKERYNAKREELFPISNVKDTISTEKVDNKSYEDSDNYKLLNNVTSLKPTLDKHNNLSVEKAIKLGKSEVVVKLKIANSLYGSMLNIKWNGDISDFNILCKQSDLFTHLRNLGYQMKVARQTSDNYFVFSDLVNYDKNIVITEFALKDHWDRVHKAAKLALNILDAYNNVPKNKKLYHVAKKENKDSILKDGLLATKAGSNTGLAVPGSVYVTTDVDALVSSMTQFKKGEYIIFEVNPSGYKLKPDFYEPSLFGVSFYIQDSIEPNDLKIVGVLEDGVQKQYSIDDNKDDFMSDKEMFADDLDSFIKLDKITKVNILIDNKSIELECIRGNNVIITLDNKDYNLSLDDFKSIIKDRGLALTIKDLNKPNTVDSLVSKEELEDYLYDYSDIEVNKDSYNIVYKEDGNYKAYMQVNFNEPVGKYIVHFKYVDKYLHNAEVFPYINAMTKVKSDTIFSTLEGSQLTVKKSIYNKSSLESQANLVDDIKASWLDFKAQVDIVDDYIKSDLEAIEKVSSEPSLKDYATSIIGVTPKEVGRNALQWDDLPTGNKNLRGRLKVSEKQILSSIYLEDVDTQAFTDVFTSEHDSILKALGFIRRNGNSFFYKENVKDIGKQLPNVWEDFNNAITQLSDILRDINNEKPKEAREVLKNFEHKVKSDKYSLIVRGDIWKDSKVMTYFEIHDEVGKMIYNQSINTSFSLLEDREDDIKYLLSRGYVTPIYNYLDRGITNTFQVALRNAKHSEKKEIEEEEFRKYWLDKEVKRDYVAKEIKNLASKLGVAYALRGSIARVLVPFDTLTQAQLDSLGAILKDTDKSVSSLQDLCKTYGNITEFKGLPDSNAPKTMPFNISSEELDAHNKLYNFLKTHESEIKNKKTAKSIKREAKAPIEATKMQSDSTAKKERSTSDIHSAERMAKLFLVKDKNHREQLERLVPIVKKLANDVDRDPDFNSFFLEEPTEMRKYKLPTVALALTCYDTTKTRQELVKTPLYKKFNNARGTSLIAKWHKNIDPDGEECMMCFFVDKQWEKESRDNLNAIKRFMRLHESIGHKIYVNGVEMLLESIEQGVATILNNGNYIDLDLDAMYVYESTQCSDVCVDVKDDLLNKPRVRRKLKIREK